MRRRRLLGYGAGVLAGAGAAAAAGWAGLADRPGPPADAPAELRIATGPPGAVYREIGAGLAAVLAERFPRTRVWAVPTGASVDNLNLLASGGTELAFASLDATVAGLRSGTPHDVTAVARLYDSWFQALVPYGSPVRGLTDLTGRPVAAGASGSGTRFTTDRLVAVAGIAPRLVTATQDAGADALAAGTVDALLTLTGVPTPAVTRLARTTRVRLLRLDTYADAMVDRFGDLYAKATLPSSAYPGIAAAVTFTTPNVLLAHPDLPDDVVETVAAALFAERARIALGHPEANRINVRTGIATGPIRLHPGAVRYFRSVKS